MKIPIAISARHIHLNHQDLETLLGKGAKLIKARDLKQVGEYASQQTVTLVGSKSQLVGVRIVGPLREKTQVEITKTDAWRLGVVAPVRLSGDLAGSGSLKIIGAEGEVELLEGVIVAKRHIHASKQQAAKYNLRQNQQVSVKITGERSTTFH
ncbi:propanediol utilization protein, partial [Patescibacteria group bacterium]|nr:propanediol utilization protein [Patescibacteria group bacterium]